MDYKWVKLPKLDRFEKFELNIPSDRVFLWAFRKSQNYSNWTDRTKVIVIRKHNSRHNLCEPISCVYSYLCSQYR